MPKFYDYSPVYFVFVSFTPFVVVVVVIIVVVQIEMLLIFIFICCL